MRKPFVLRVQNDDPALARGIARALAEPLDARGARVRITTAARGLPGTSIAIGVYDEENGARWLAPLDVEDAPETAAPRVIAFLEEWGFIGAVLQRASAARPEYAS